MDAAKTGGERLRAWREGARAEVTLKSVADEFGISSPALLDWEAGRRKPNLKHALVIERVTGGIVRVDAWGEDLVAERDEMIAALNDCPSHPTAA